MADFEPVELDFMYGGNTQTEGPKIVKTTEQIAAAHSEATKMIQRHNATITELRKDLVQLGTDYKRAMSKEAKSEILTEIELTKKNIIDETAAVKTLKAEIASLNKMPKATTMPDAASIGKAAVGYNSLSFSTQQLVRELPAATMGLNMFFLAISNNIPVLTDGIKRARAENEALKKSNETGVPVWKQLLSSLVSWQSLMMVGITLLSMYGKEIFSWVNELFTGEKAVKKLTDAQLGLATSTKTMMEALSSGSEIQKAYTTIERLSVSLKDARGNHELERKAVDEYNNSLGVTFGKVTDVDGALKKIQQNQDAYIEAMKNMSFANAFFSQSASDAMKAMEIGMKNQQQLLKDAGQDGKKMWEQLQEFDTQIAKAKEEQKKGLNPNAAVQIGGIFGTSYSMQGAINARNELAKKMITIANEEQQRQLDVVNKHQDKSLEEAKDYYTKYAAIFKDNNWTVDLKNTTDQHLENIYDSTKDFLDLIYGINQKANNMMTSLDEDGLAKRISIINADKDAELKAIQEKSVAIIDEYNKNQKAQADAYNKSHPGANKQASQLSTKSEDISTSLFAINPQAATTLQNAINNIIEVYGQKSVETTAKWNEELNKLGVQYMDKRTQIEVESNAKIEEYKKKGLFILAALEKKHQEDQISNLEKSKIEEEDIYKFASDDKLKLTKELNAKLISEAKAKIEADKKLSADDKNKLLTKIDEANVSKANGSIDGIVMSLRKLKKAKEDAASARSTGDTTGEVKASKDIQQYTSDLEKYGNEVLNYFDQVSNGILGIMDQLGVFTDDEKEAANQIVGMVSGAGDLAVGIASGNVSQIISGGLSLVSNAISFFDTKSKDIAKKQKNIEKTIDSLTAAYNRLQTAVENALGTDVYDAQKSQIENLKAQIEANEAWIEQENRKKSKKRDKEAIAERQAQIEELKNQIDDITDTITESLAQTNAVDLANQLGDALVTAFQNGESAAEAMGATAKDVLKNAVTNALKLQFLEKPMQDAVEQLAASMEDGKLSQDESKSFEDKIKAAGEQYYAMLAQYSDLFTSDASSSQTGIQGDVTKMTEETGSALVGQITAMRLNVAALLANSKSSLDSVGKVLASLEAIRVNTEPIAEVREILNYLKLNGIKVI